MLAKVFAKLRGLPSLPEERKQSLALALAGAITAALFLVWAVSFFHSLANRPREEAVAEDAASSTAPSPFQALKDSFRGFSGIIEYSRTIGKPQMTPPYPEVGASSAESAATSSESSSGAFFIRP